MKFNTSWKKEDSMIDTDILKWLNAQKEFHIYGEWDQTIESKFLTIPPLILEGLVWEYQWKRKNIGLLVNYMVMSIEA